MTASSDDPALDNPYEHIKAEFIGGNNKAFAKMNFLNAVIVISTIPGLDVYHGNAPKMYNITYIFLTQQRRSLYIVCLVLTIMMQ